MRLLRTLSPGWQRRWLEEGQAHWRGPRPCGFLLRSSDFYCDAMNGYQTSRSIAISLIALLIGGCIAPISTPRMGPVTPFGRDATLIYVPGIGGCGRSDAEWTRGLRAGGYDGKIEVRDWSSRLGPLDALWGHERQRVEARQIALRIRRLRAESPSSPIVLAAHSAGAGLVVHALEDLPPDTHVDGLVLLAPALSRTYDLTRALRHVHGRADVFCSDRDTLVLAIGTFLFGTVDGVHDEAAGHGGFVRPARSEVDQYAKLHIHRFSHARQLLGDDGGHYGPQSSSVAAVLVAPLLPRSESPAARPAVASTVLEAR